MVVCIRLRALRQKFKKIAYLPAVPVQTPEKGRHALLEEQCSGEFWSFLVELLYKHHGLARTSLPLSQH